MARAENHFRDERTFWYHNVRADETVSEVLARLIGSTDHLGDVLTDSGLASEDDATPGTEIAIRKDYLDPVPQVRSEAPRPPETATILDVVGVAEGFDIFSAQRREEPPPDRRVRGGRWTTGFPAVQIDNLSAANQPVVPIHLDCRRIRTAKRIGDPVGTWSIELVPRGEASFPGFTPDPLGRKGRGAFVDHRDPYWYRYFRPMDMVSIDLAYGRTNLRGSADPLMLGWVDRVTRTRQKTGDQIHGGVTVEGRDVGKLLVEDRVDYYPLIDESAWTDEARARISQKVDNADFSGLNDRILQRIFGRAYGFLEDGTSVWFNSSYEAVRFIGNRFMAPLAKARGDIHVSDWWQIAIDPALRDRAIANSNLMTQKGSIWEFFEHVLDMPFVELFTDTWRGKGTLFVRRRPYDAAIWEALEVRYPERAADQEGRLYHRIEEEEIRSESLTVTDAEHINCYYLEPEAMIIDQPLRALQVPAWIAYPFVERFLQRSRQWESTTIACTDDRPETLWNSTQLKLAALDRDRLIRWFLPEVFMERGTVVIRGRPDIRIGDRVLLSARDLLAYVVGVQHEWSAAGPTWSTTLELTRIWPRGGYRHILDFAIRDQIAGLTVEEVEKYYRSGIIA